MMPSHLIPKNLTIRRSRKTIEKLRRCTRFSQNHQLPRQLSGTAIPVLHQHRWTTLLEALKLSTNPPLPVTDCQSPVHHFRLAYVVSQCINWAQSIKSTHLIFIWQVESWGSERSRDTWRDAFQRCNKWRARAWTKSLNGQVENILWCLVSSRTKIEPNQNRKANFGSFSYPSDRSDPISSTNKTVRQLLIASTLEL